VADDSTCDDLARAGDKAGGDGMAGGSLFIQVYDALRDLARRRLGHERVGHTLTATALVHEVYVRVVGGDPDGKWAGEAHFFHAAAEAMRRILIEHARTRGRAKRGGTRRRLTLDVPDVLGMAEEDDPAVILGVDEAVTRLAEESPDLASMVRLRFYAGLSVEETARVLGVSARTVNRDWAYARAWLFKTLEGQAED
jgi:RNA polymerase sigma factor (TIGR02999 family)